MKKFLLSLLFFFFAPLTLVVSLYSLHQISQMKTVALVDPQSGLVLGTNTALELYSALPPKVGTISQSITTGEARPLILKKYLEKHNSPITSYADLIFQTSEKWGIDYRLMMAIAQCESNLCKRIPEGSYNCWGFENGDTRFLSWEQALNQVAKTLKEGYIDQGLTTPDQIMPKYAPPSVEKGGPWAKCVNQFLQELE